MGKTTQTVQGILNEIYSTDQDGQPIIKTSTSHEHSDLIHLDAENVATTTGYMLIDLSDTTNWPHTNTGSIGLDFVSVVINSSKTFAGDIELGFLSSVDATNGDFNIIHTWHSDQTGTNETGNIFGTIQFNQFRCIATNWFGPTTSDDTTWQTDVNIVRPDGGNSFSGNGDLVLKVNRTAGNVDVGITVGYHTHA